MCIKCFTQISCSCFVSCTCWRLDKGYLIFGIVIARSFSLFNGGSTFLRVLTLQHFPLPHPLFYIYQLLPPLISQLQNHSNPHKPFNNHNLLLLQFLFPLIKVRLYTSSTTSPWTTTSMFLHSSSAPFLYKSWRTRSRFQRASPTTVNASKRGSFLGKIPHAPSPNNPCQITPISPLTTLFGDSSKPGVQWTLLTASKGSQLQNLPLTRLRFRSFSKTLLTPLSYASEDSNPSLREARQISDAWKLQVLLSS